VTVGELASTLEAIGGVCRIGCVGRWQVTIATWQTESTAVGDTLEDALRTCVQLVLARKVEIGHGGGR
jgi:hypothetical protein